MRLERSVFERAGLVSGLLTEEQIDEAWQVLVESSPATDLSLEEITDAQLAQQLIELKYLNQWQAEQLCHGRTKFTLGSYSIVDAIGHGGMGWVFKGEHKLLGRTEAIKVLPRDQSSPSSIASFCREIRAQASLDHPNLVRLSYADTDGDTYFLVTEYVPGSDLRRLVHDHGPLTSVKAAILVSQAAEGLAYAHEQGLVHRDIKPSNLLITPEGKTKLTDLGLVFFSADQKEEEISKPRHIVGTADFLAPEIVISPGEVRAISDIYSLGCTLYYAVTGKVPYPGGETAVKLRRHLEEEPISPQRLNPFVDDAMLHVIESLMVKQPEQRVATASEVVLLLKPWVDAATENDWLEIGRLAQERGTRKYEYAALADTKPAAGPVIPQSFLPGSTERVSETKPVSVELQPVNEQSSSDAAEQESTTWGWGPKSLVVFLAIVVLLVVAKVLF